VTTYSYAASWLEPQVVLLLLGWTSDPNGMACMISLYQKELAWGNESCKTLALLFPTVKGPGQKPSRTIRPPSSIHANHTSCLCRYGESLMFVSNLTGCDKSWSFDEMSNQNALTKAWADVWWYYGGPLLEILQKIETKSTLGSIGHPFHPGISKIWPI
jgi:hypothetical protein